MRHTTDVEPPSDDKRWRIVKATMRRNGFRPDGLIEALHTVQASFGYLDEASLQYVADSLNVSPSQVYGVATFYHYFQMKPGGRHTCSVCMGTACYIKGGDKILEQIQEEYDVEPGETTADGELSLLSVRCVGACGMAPVVSVDGHALGNKSVEEMVDAVRARLADAKETVPEEVAS